MTEISARDARRQFKEILDRAAAGEEIAITRHGERVAVLGPPRAAEPRHLPRLESFRAGIERRGKPFSQDVVDGRGEERY